MLTKDDLQHIAKLARLKLTESEAQSFSGELTAILNSFNEISKIPTEGIEPLVTPTDIVHALRADQVKGRDKNGETEALLSNAPEKSGHLFKVPPVV